MSTLEARRTAMRRFGWSSLFVWATVGMGLEALHGWKVEEYLGDELARTLLTLGHAHGVGLALVVLVFGEAGVPLFARAGDGGASLALRAAAVLIPLGFSLSAPYHPEGDPGLAVWLVPLGGAALVYALARTAWAAWTATPPPPNSS